MPPPQTMKLWPEDSVLDKKDKEISQPFFKMTIGGLELPLSFFCLFGMPPSLFVCPLLLGLIANGWPPSFGASVLLFVSGGLVCAVWVAFCKDKHYDLSLMLFFSFKSALIFPIAGLVLARIGAGSDGFGVGAFYTTAWFSFMCPIHILKAVCLRRRPASTGAVSAIARANTRKIESISKVVRMDGQKSFPSGDTAGAVAFAVPLAVACGGEIGPILGLLCVVACAFARLYWRAHYVVDVAAGSLIGVLGAYMLQSLCPVGQVRWFHPLIAHMLLMISRELTTAILEPRKFHQGQLGQMYLKFFPKKVGGVSKPPPVVPPMTPQSSMPGHAASSPAPKDAPSTSMPDSKAADTSGSADQAQPKDSDDKKDN